MTGFAGYGAMAIIVTGIAAGFWLRHRRLARETGGRGTGVSKSLLCLAAAGTGFCLWSAYLDRPDNSFDRQSRVTAIAIAFDLSPSMRAIPDPEFSDNAPPRYVRARNVLLSLIHAIEEQRRPVIVSIAGFTRQGDILMGWDDSITQVREVLEYAVTPDLFDSYGTSMEAAAESIVHLFDMLPASLRESRRLAIIVSDGEDTDSAASVGYALETIAGTSLDVVALQTGSLDGNEGVPSYGALGEFAGFIRMGGQLHTVPDTRNMAALARSAPGRGLYLRAEAPDSTDRLMEFVIEGKDTPDNLDTDLLSTIGMFSVVFFICAIMLR